MTNEGSAVYCNRCTYQAIDRRTQEARLKHIVLGSVTPECALTIKTKQGWLTLTVDHLTIIHECGYSIDVQVKDPGFKRVDYATNN